MQKSFTSKYTIALVVILLGISFQAQAYKLNGIKWTGGAYNYTINPIGVDNGTNYSSYSTTVINGAAVWTSVATSNVQLNYLGTTSNTVWGGTWPPDYENVITWKTTGWSGSVIGVSTYWFSGTQILDSDIKLNTAFANDSRLSQLVTHEVGHSLGIGHTQESGNSYTADEYNSIMYWLLHGQTLNQEDKCAITAIYPASSACSPPFAAGTYACSACCSDGAVVEVSVDITNNVYTYNGLARNVTVTTSPAGLAHTVTYYDQYNNATANPTNAGTYDVVVTITESGYEGEGPFNGTLTINKKGLTVLSDNKQINFGEPQPTYTISISGFVNGDDSADLTTAPSAYISTTWPANPGQYTIYLTPGSDDNYSFSYTQGTLTVTGLTVNSVTISNNSYFYDGTNKEISVTTNPLGIGYTIEYHLNGQPVPNKINAGTYSVTITINEPGYNPDQYQASLTIEKVQLTATANNQTTVYNSAEPEYTITFSGFVNGETTTIINELPTAEPTNNWPLLPGIYDIITSGGYDNNYSFATMNGTLTVTPAILDSVSFNNLEYTYDGIQHQPTITTFPEGVETEIIYFDTANNMVAEIKDAGIYNVVAVVVDAGYSGETYSELLTVNKAPLIATANNVTLSYGDPQPKYAVTYSGFVAGEDTTVIDNKPSPSVEGNWPLLPGNYEIKLNEGADNNYEITTLNGLLNVKNKSAIISTSDTLLVYNGQPQEATIKTLPSNIQKDIIYLDNNLDTIPPPSLPGNYQVQISIKEPGYDQTVKKHPFIIKKASLTVLVENETINFGENLPNFNYSISGFINGENESKITTLPQFRAIGGEPLLPGDYNIIASDGESATYSFNYISGKLTVNPLTVESIKISDTLFRYKGHTKGITVETIPTGIDFDVTYFDENQKQVTAPKNSGEYSYQLTITEPGYKNSYSTGKITVTPTPLHVYMDTINLIYGEEVPEIKLRYDGFIEGESIENIDKLPTTTLLANGLWNVGIYNIEISGGEDENYTFSYTTGQINVYPALLTVTPDDFYIHYNDSIPELTYTIAGFVNNENESILTKSPTIILENKGSFEPGLYDLKASGGVASNYKFEYETSGFWIEPIGYIVITISDTLGTYTGSEHAVTIETIPPGINYSIEYDRKPIDAGTYKTIVTIEETGYLREVDSCEVIIEKAPLTVTVLNDSVLLNEERPNFEIRFDGFVNNESKGVIDEMPKAKLIESNPATAGVFPIEITGGFDNNYAFNYKNATLTVLQTYAVNVNATENGKVSINDTQLLLDNIQEWILANENSSTFYAVANKGFSFTGWDNGSTENPISFKNIEQNITISAIFSSNVGTSSIADNKVELIVYPNPAYENEVVKIKVNFSEEKYWGSKIIVSDITGRIVAKIEEVKEENQIEGLAKGAYVFSLQMHGEILKNRKLIIR